MYGQRYRAEREYVNVPFFTRAVATITVLYNLALIFRLVDFSKAQFDAEKIAEGEWWRVFTSFMWYGITGHHAGSFIRYIFAMIGFVRYLGKLEGDFFYGRAGEFYKMMGIFVTLIVFFAVKLDQAVFLGDALRVAVITVWADLYYLDTFTCVAGMDLSRFRATSFPLIWIGLFTFLDYPISLTQMSNLHFQLFGFLIGKIYGALAWKLNWVPDYWKNRQWGELNELIPPGEMFCYLILALLRGGSFL